MGPFSYLAICFTSGAAKGGSEGRAGLLLGGFLSMTLLPLYSTTNADIDQRQRQTAPAASADEQPEEGIKMLTTDFEIISGDISF